MYVPVAPNVITFEAMPWMPVTPLDTAAGNVNVCATLATVIASWILPFAPLGGKFENASVLVAFVVTV